MTKKTGEAKGEQFTFETDEERKLWFAMACERLGASATTIGEALREADAFILVEFELFALSLPHGT